MKYLSLFFLLVGNLAFGLVSSINMASTNLPTTYATGSQYSSSGTGKGTVCLINGSSTGAIYGTTSNTANCASAPDQWYFPASVASCYTSYPATLKYICFRSGSGAPLTTGTNYLIYY